MAFWGTGFAQLPTAEDSLSGHDLIVLHDGKVIRAKVLEIGIELIKYKRAEYINGPLYSIERVQVYAINYPNGKTDYFLAADGSNFIKKKEDSKKKKSKLDFKKNGQVSMGLGFIKSYSKGENFLSNLKQTSFLPAFNFRYSFEKSASLRLGFQLGIASYNFEGDEFNAYDQVITSGIAKETAFSLTAFGKYTVGTGNLQPYILAGGGLNISNISSELTVLPVDSNSDEIYKINTGAQNTSLAVLIRGGVSYAMGSKYRFYGDVGTGLSILQVGAVFNLGK